MTPGVRTVYVVTRLNLVVDNAMYDVPQLSFHAIYQPRTDADSGEYRVPEAAFADRAEAERDAHRRERAARELLNPFSFDYGDPAALSSLNAVQLRAELSARTVAPPVPVADSYYDGRNLARWWDTESANWSAALRAELWELFDKVKLYDVQEVPFE
jgi:hypothetical protein